MRYTKDKNIRKLVLSAMMLAIGMLLPLLTMQIKEIGDTLLPMHLPVMICGAVCGGGYGLVVGTALPFMRSFIFGMPPMYPQAVWMACELAAYGLCMGILCCPKGAPGLGRIYLSLITSMIVGRVVWATAKIVLLMSTPHPFTFNAFIAGGFVDALPGIVLQLILVPAIVIIINKYSNVQK